VFKRYGLLLLCALLASCGAPPPRESGHAPGGVIAANPQPPAGVTVYRIDPRQSELRLLVYRAGPMAQLGHNHVIINRALGGWVGISDTVTASSFWWQVPVAKFVVDEAAARHEEGADFAADVAAADKSGTERNMMSAALLNDAQFPQITVRSLSVGAFESDGAARTSSVPAADTARVRITAPAPAWVATLEIQVAGHASKISVPFALERGGGRLTATGSVALRQSALGLTPFSVMLGALQVQDEMRIKFKIVAVAT
jgi:hypothetical protein